MRLRKWQAKFAGGGIGFIAGAGLGILPGVDDALRPTQYAQMFGRAAVIEMFLPTAFVGALVGACVGALAGSRYWHSRQPGRPAVRPAPDEQAWPPAPRKP